MLWTVPVIAKAVAGSLFAGSAGFGMYQAVATPKVTRTMQDVFAACGLCNVGKDGAPKPWKVQRVSKTHTGLRMVLRFPYGKTLSDVTRKADAINTALGSDCAFTKDGAFLVMDIPQHPLPSYISFSEKVFQLTRGEWTVAIGLTVQGEWMLHDFSARPHLLLAGQTRFGKSEALKVIICTLYECHTPLEVEFIGVDMKPCSLEFRKFNGVWTNLVSEPVQFLNLLIEAKKDMNQRAQKLADAGCSNVKQYERVTGERFKRRFIIVDEYGKSYGSEWEKEIAQEVMQVSAMGAGLGIHLVLCTQRPDADVIDGKIRANIGSIICLPVSTAIQSRVVLGHEGAELLPEIPGRAIYHAYGKEEIIQIPYISDVKLAKMLPSNQVYNSGNAGWKPFQARSSRIEGEFDG